MVEMCGQCKMSSLRKVTTPGRKAAFIQGREHRTLRKIRVYWERRVEEGSRVEWMYFFVFFFTAKPN